MRKHRCSCHPDFLVGDDGCPWCKIIELRKQIEDLQSREETLAGEPVAVAISADYEKILGPIIRSLGFNRASHYSNALIRIGKRGEYSSTYILPTNMTEALRESAVEAGKQRVQAMVYAIRSVEHRISSNIVEALKNTVEEIVKSGPSEEAGAEAIVHEILGNINNSRISWDDSRKVADLASKAVKKFIMKFREKEHGSKQNTKND